jgi:hypothetical protein
MKQGLGTAIRKGTLPPFGTSRGTFELKTGYEQRLEAWTDLVALAPVRPARPQRLTGGVVSIPTHADATVAGSPGLTPEQLEADRAMCAMLGIDPAQLAEERLEELRSLWR